MSESIALDEASSMSRWYVYIARCADQTLYTGVTTDVIRREAEHNGSGKRGARYTKVRRPIAIVWFESAADRACACRREAAIKKLTRRQKLGLIESFPPDLPE